MTVKFDYLNPLRSRDTKGIVTPESGRSRNEPQGRGVSRKSRNFSGIFWVTQIKSLIIFQRKISQVSNFCSIAVTFLLARS